MQRIEYALTDPSNVNIGDDTEIHFGSELWEDVKLQLEVEAMEDWYELLVQTERERYAV